MQQHTRRESAVSFYRQENRGSERSGWPKATPLAGGRAWGPTDPPCSIPTSGFTFQLTFVLGWVPSCHSGWVLGFHCSPQKQPWYLIAQLSAGSARGRQQREAPPLGEPTSVALVWGDRSLPRALGRRKGREGGQATTQGVGWGVSRPQRRPRQPWPGVTATPCFPRGSQC